MKTNQPMNSGNLKIPMKNSRPNALRIWKQLEEHLVPRLRLSVTDRAVYAYLLSHSRLEGRPRLRFSILGLARQIHLTGAPVRDSVRRLVGHGALRLIERSKTGHVVGVRLPGEIRAARPQSRDTSAVGPLHRACPPVVRRGGWRMAGLGGTVNLEEADFLGSRKLRQAIHAREGGLCFYCLRKIKARLHCLDHVVPRAHSGRNSYRNLVSCCMECNASKGERRADDFLRSLYRDGRLTPAELRARLRALGALASGKLVPLLQS